ncbi:OsmC family protein [Streptomyces sp. NPDC050625]|uniref:OsmC family protein n=1 Tax=Streptomyces sp. NPDC050625 TaxID=3154629 RepID=UPI0034306128
MATCVAFYAGRYLHRHGLPRAGLRVRTEFTMATDRPARVATLHVVVVPPPELPEQRRAALLAVASHCTVHNTLHQPPEIDIALEP